MATTARAGLKVRIDTVDRVARASKVRGCAVLPVLAYTHFALHCHWQHQQHCLELHKRRHYRHHGPALMRQLIGTCS